MKREDLEREAQKIVDNLESMCSIRELIENPTDEYYLRKVTLAGIMRGIELGFEAARASKEEAPDGQNYLWDYLADASVLDKYATPQDFLASLDDKLLVKDDTL